LSKKESIGVDEFHQVGSDAHWENHLGIIQTIKQPGHHLLES
jgi:hypothetical protein